MVASVHPNLVVLKHIFIIHRPFFLCKPISRKDILCRNLTASCFYPLPLFFLQVPQVLPANHFDHSRSIPRAWPFLKALALVEIYGGQRAYKFQTHRPRCGNTAVVSVFCVIFMQRLLLYKTLPVWGDSGGISPQGQHQSACRHPVR